MQILRRSLDRLAYRYLNRTPEFTPELFYQLRDRCQREYGYLPLDLGWPYWLVCLKIAVLRFWWSMTDD